MSLDTHRFGWYTGCMAEQRLRADDVIGWQVTDRFGAPWRSALAGLLDLAHARHIKVFTVGHRFEGADGEFLPAERRINLYRRLTKRQLVVYLAHELGHVLIRSSKLNTRYAAAQSVVHNPSTAYRLETLDEEFEAWWNAARVLETLAPGLASSRTFVRARELALLSYVRWSLLGAKEKRTPQGKVPNPPAGPTLV